VGPQGAAICSPIPRFFFNVHDRKDLPDTVGTELADRDAAREAANLAVEASLG
jgi:hypothetical protein